MDCFVKTIASLAGGHAVELVGVVGWDVFGSELSSGYTVAQWSHDRQVDRDTRLFFHRIATKTGLPADVDESTSDRFYLADFFLGTDVASDGHETEARGLGMAFVLAGMAVSLPSEERWGETTIPLRQVWYDPNGTMCELGVTVLNASRPDQAQAVLDEHVARTQRSLRERPQQGGATLRESLPHLEFGTDVDDQLTELPTATRQRAFTKLIVLDAAVRDWRRNPSQTRPELSGCSRESQPTMQKYGQRRSFRDAEGSSRIFEDHVRVGRYYRIHFRIVERARTLEIGYIGKHLPTVKFR